MSTGTIVRRLERHHQVARRAPAEPQRAVQALLFVGLEQAAVAALGDEQLDFIRRVQVPLRDRRAPTQPQEQRRRGR